jgi:hypothetical protein
MGRKYMIFRAEWTEEEGADNRLLAHTGAYTDILAEYFDSSNAPIPHRGTDCWSFTALTVPVLAPTTALETGKW